MEASQTALKPGIELAADPVSVLSLTVSTSVGTSACSSSVTPHECANMTSALAVGVLDGPHSPLLLEPEHIMDSFHEDWGHLFGPNSGDKDIALDLEHHQLPFSFGQEGGGSGLAHQAGPHTLTEEGHTHHDLPAAQMPMFNAGQDMPAAPDLPTFIQVAGLPAVGGPPEAIARADSHHTSHHTHSPSSSSPSSGWTSSHHAHHHHTASAPAHLHDTHSCPALYALAQSAQAAPQPPVPDWSLYAAAQAHMLQQQLSAGAVPGSLVPVPGVPGATAGVGSAEPAATTTTGQRPYQPRATRNDPVAKEAAKERAKEASKNAQRRFREKQRKALADLEAEVAEKLAAFKMLSAENAVLSAQARVLEQAVVTRDEQIAVLTKVREAVNNTQLPPAQYGCTLTSAVSAADAARFKTMTKNDMWMLWRNFLGEASGFLLQCQGRNVLSSDALLPAITASVQRVGYVLRHVITLAPAAVRDLIEVNLETGQQVVASEEHWESVVTSLELSAIQKQDILGVITLYNNLMAQVYKDRAALLKALGHKVDDSTAATSPHTALTLSAMQQTPAHQASAAQAQAQAPAQQQQQQNQAPSSAPAQPPSIGYHAGHVPGSINHTQRQQGLMGLNEFELVDRLQANLHKEHCARILLYCFWLGSVITPVQVLRVAVNSHPFFPDVVALARAVERLAHPHQRSKSI